MKIYDVLKKPRLTEKAYLNISQNKYVFEVDIHASKNDVKRSIEELFGVDVLSVHTMNVRGKEKTRGAMRRNVIRTSRKKKAIVEIKDGQTIKIFDEIYKSDEK